MVETVVINDPRRRDRWEKTMKVLRGFPYLEIRRSPAVFVNKSRVVPGKTVTTAECGCAMAHRRVWQEYYNSGNTDPIIIFEDDILFSARADIVKKYIQLELGELRSGRKHISHLGWYSMYGVGKYLGAYAYMINRQGAAILLREFSTECPTLSFDVILSRLIASGTIRGGNTLNHQSPTPFYKGIFRPDLEGSTIGYWTRGANAIALHSRDMFGYAKKKLVG